MSTVTIRGLSLTYAGPPPVAALVGVDLDVEAGSLVAVLGPSGCGKTTLLRVLAGLERPGAGTIRLGSRDLDAPGTSVPPERRGIGLVPQEGALFPHLDVAGNIGFGLTALERGPRRSRVEEMLELVGLEGSGARRPSELSGGQQQRVALARALAPSPEIVLLDEPFSALDASLRASLRDEVAALLRSTGTTSVLVTHDQDEALTVADSVALMRDGHLVQTGTPHHVYHHPVDLWAARFLGEVVVLPGLLQGPHVTCDLGTLTVATGTTPADVPVDVLLRPEQLRLGPEAGEPGASGPRGVRAHVTAVRFHGADSTVTLAVAGRSLEARAGSAEVPAVGAVVEVVILGPALVVPRAPGPAAAHADG